MRIRSPISSATCGGGACGRPRWAASWQRCAGSTDSWSPRGWPRATPPSGSTVPAGRPAFPRPWASTRWRRCWVLPTPQSRWDDGTGRCSSSSTPPAPGSRKPWGSTWRRWTSKKGRSSSRERAPSSAWCRWVARPAGPSPSTSRIGWRCDGEEGTRGECSSMLGDGPSPARVCGESSGATPAGRASPQSGSRLTFFDTRPPHTWWKEGPT